MTALRKQLYKRAFKNSVVKGMNGTENTIHEGERTHEDWILALLGVNENKAINGNLMFIKELFLLSNEIKPKLKGKDPDFKFYPYDLGPYSSIAARTINKLVKEGIIEAIPISTEEQKESFRFKLTDKGKKAARNSMNKFPDDALKIISRKRKGWDQLGYYGIVRKVYHEYPEYTIHSKIKKGVLDGS